MFRYKLSAVEKIVVVLVIIMVAAGFILFYTSLPGFEWYIAEDHLVEWITVMGLLLASVVCISRFFRLLKYRNWWFLAVTLLLGVFLFFAAGEEISWGQRILGIESSDYFLKNNAQGETNLHNLVVDGVKINKLIFSLVLGAAMAIYLIVIPLLYARNMAAKNFLNKSGAPVARFYQVLAFAMVAGITTLLPHGKNAELLECGAAMLFFLIIRYPVNHGIFTRSGSVV